MVRRFLGLVLVGVSVFCLTGCETFNEAFKQALEEGSNSENPNSEDYRPKFVVSINSVVEYPRAGDLEREIEGIDGKSVWINSVPIFSSMNISDARVVARPGNPDLCDPAVQDRPGGQTEMAGGFRQSSRRRGRVRGGRGLFRLVHAGIAGR